MEDLSGLGVMRAGTIRMKKYPRFADHISTFMANVLFYTSDLHRDPKEKKRLVKEFINPDLCRITEDLIFTDPYYDCPRNNVSSALRPYLERVFWKKSCLRLEASKFKYKFLTAAESLVHGDLHTGSIFADETRTKAFDPEFAFFGPIAFDPGLLIGISSSTMSPGTARTIRPKRYGTIESTCWERSTRLTGCSTRSSK